VHAAEVDPRFQPFVDAFDAAVVDGCPAALVVREGDRVVVDLAAGTDRRGVPFTSHRPVFLYSAIKPVAALAVLVAAVDAGLDLDVPVASVWPDFAAHGKDRVTIAQALAHGAAVPGWRERWSGRALRDGEAAEAALAAAAPWWPVGEPGEHAVSYGHLADGILRHATGRDVVAWAADAVGATGTRLSIVPPDGERAPAPLDDPHGAWRDSMRETPGLMGELLQNPPELLDVHWLNGPEGRSLVAPAVTGYGSAHDLAGLWAWWRGDAAAERLGTDLRDRSLRPEIIGHDHVLDRHVAWGLGPQIDPDSFGMGGVGGCGGWHEVTLGLSIGLTTPRVGPADRFDALDEAVRSLS
jgi:CubicO group peptidase (beta-lactamase class C family)